MGPHLQNSTLLLKAGPGLFCTLRALEARGWDEHRQGTPSPSPPLRAQRPLHLSQAFCLLGEFGLCHLQMFLREDPKDVKNLRTPLCPKARSRALGSDAPPRQARRPAHSHTPPPAPPEYLQRHKLSPQLLLCSLLTQLFSSIVEKLGTELVSDWLMGLGGEGVA